MAQSFLYENWPDDLRKAELASLAGLLPNAWLAVVTRLTRTDQVTNVKVHDPNNDGEFCHLGDLSQQDKLAVRLFRYLSSEQLFALLLSGQGDMPLARFNSVVRADHLNSAYTSIAAQKVPEGYASVCGRSYAFSEWLGFKATGNSEPALCPTLERFIINEAAFVAERDFVNGIKHGRARAASNTSALGINVEHDGAWHELLPATEVICVETWREKKTTKGSEFLHSLSFETFDFREDIGVLYVNSLIVSAILAWRIATLEMLIEKASKVNVSFPFPNKIEGSNSIMRFKGLPAEDFERRSNIGDDYGTS
ncbi:hypothetical protein [Paracoccus aerodenitrificans]|uniref:hypothetical protein n=1 Tax=Paracoccus aerodenitrificans TaxID=3017781 RepID=UPI0022F0C677|nr:hypothetical protein [Paracoccus aerodenitrificans]WBU65319.1 hypothetical protein PAE61_07860 [Paracoccus aerodenitrificans]